MFGSFALGGIATLVLWAGIILFGWEFMHNSTQPVLYLVSLGLIIYSRYLKYVSRHSVRVSR
jgi:hypothetical protein